MFYRSFAFPMPRSGLVPPDGKRLVDLGLTLLLAPLWLPVTGLVALLVACCGGGPVLHGQWRVGRGGRAFRLWKFRTMVPGAEAELATVLARDGALARIWARHAKLRHDPRVTRPGRFLRRYSLDEVPQFWNVLCGDMSLVGPRPVPAAELQAQYGPAADAYLACRPGLTGLWQVSGRNDLDYAGRVALDIRYARDRDARLDAIILLRTVGAVLRGTGC